MKCKITDDQKRSAYFQIRIFEHANQYKPDLKSRDYRERIKRISCNIHNPAMTAHGYTLFAFNEQFCKKCKRKRK